jgi:hypothetical protein
LFELSMSSSHSHLLSVAGLCRRTPIRSPNRRNYRAEAGQLRATRDFHRESGSRGGRRIFRSGGPEQKIFSSRGNQPVAVQVVSSLRAVARTPRSGLPGSPTPCDCRRFSTRAIRTAVARGVPCGGTEGRYVSFCGRAARWQPKISSVGCSNRRSCGCRFRRPARGGRRPCSGSTWRRTLC